MKAEFFVKIESRKNGSKWFFSAVEARKNKPGTRPNQVALKLSIEIPDAYFETPELSAQIIVPEDCINKPVITPEIQHNLAQEISKQLGFQVHISVPDVIEKGSEGC